MRKLIVPMDNAGESFVAAIETEHGKNVWKTPRSRDINWATPAVLYKDGQKAEYFSQAAVVSSPTMHRLANKPGSSTPVPRFLRRRLSMTCL